MKKVKDFLKHQLIKGSFIILLGNGLTSFLNYLYHLITGRLLDPEQYGLLESLIVLTYFLGVITQSFSYSVINIVSRVKSSKVSLKVKTLERQALKLSLILWLMLILSYSFLKNLLHLPNFSVFFVFSLISLFSFIPTVYLAVLQARLKFLLFSILAILQTLIKDVAALILILSGFKTIGAISSFITSGFIGLVLGRFLVKNSWKDNFEGKIYRLDKNFWNFSLLSLITNLGLTSIYASDVILARFYFDSIQSGIYAAISVLGKIIFFASTSIMLVAFPLFIKNKLNLNKVKRILILALIILVSICTLGSLVFKLFPNQIVGLLYGNNYKMAGIFLPNFAIFISLFAVFTCIIQLLLALEKKSAGFLSVFVALGQIILIVAKHTSITEIINNSIKVTLIGLVLTILFIIPALKRKRI